MLIPLSFLPAYATKPSIAELIHGLRDLDSQNADFFFADDLIQEKDARTSATRSLTKLVDLGPSALPSLFSRLKDPTPTKIVIPANIKGPVRRFRTIDCRRDLQDKPDYEGDFTLFEHGDLRVTVGDVCFFVIGQITNRHYLPVDARGWVMLPSLDPKLVEQVREDWEGAGAQSLYVSLVIDALRPDVRQRDAYAVERIARYFPKSLIPLVRLRFRGSLTEAGNTDESNGDRWTLAVKEPGKMDRDQLLWFLEKVPPNTPGLQRVLIQAHDRVAEKPKTQVREEILSYLRNEQRLSPPSYGLRNAEAERLIRALKALTFADTNPIFYSRYDGEWNDPLFQLAESNPRLRSLKTLVDMGSTAIPSLLAHLDDMTLTQIEVPKKGYAPKPSQWRVVAATDYLGVDARADEGEYKSIFDNSIPFKAERLSLTVGDVCSYVLGQIGNRNYIPSTHPGPWEFWTLNMPSLEPSMVPKIRSMWSDYGHEELLASLILDVLRPDLQWRDTRGMERLVRYFPNWVVPITRAKFRLPLVDEMAPMDDSRRITAPRLGTYELVSILHFLRPVRSVALVKQAKELDGRVMQGKYDYDAGEKRGAIQAFLQGAY